MKQLFFFKGVRVIIYILIIVIFILYLIRLFFNVYKKVRKIKSINNEMFLNNNLNNYQYFQFKINLVNNKEIVENILKQKIKCWYLKQPWNNLFENLDLKQCFRIISINSNVYLHKLYKKKYLK